MDPKLLRKIFDKIIKRGTARGRSQRLGGIRWQVQQG